MVVKKPAQKKAPVKQKATPAKKPPAKKKAARTPRRSSKMLLNKKALLAAMEQTLGVVTAACRLVGVERITFYRYYNSDKEFAKAADDTSEIALDFAESQLHKQIKDGTPSSTIFYLKTKGKKRGYIEQQQIEHSGAIQTELITPKADDD